ncbi:hypothetical protein EDC04DRAFT_2914687 [Pisolithus marmoratus]|nr:hypothetical protein EDC04DRAFT_2914687 [Pisolithus marmoratus]
MPPARSQPARLQSVPLPYFRPEALKLLPLLSSQREMVYQQISHVTIAAEQEMSASEDPGPSRGWCKVAQGECPLTKKDYLRLHHQNLPSARLNLLSLKKFLKPPGEVGRPGRGGYNLEEHLKWTDNEIRELKRVIHAAVKKYLDTTKSRSFQDLEAVRKVTDLAKRLLLATRRLSELLASSRLNPPSSQVPFIKASTKASKRVLGMRLYIDHLFVF